MEDQHKHTNNGGGGFLLGVIVGVAITLLFTTKKGREIFKDTVDRALDKINELQSKVDEAVTDFEDEDIEGDDYIKPEPSSVTPKEQKEEVRYIADKKEKKDVEPEPEIDVIPFEETPVAADELKEKPVEPQESPKEEVKVVAKAEERDEEEQEELKKEPPKKSSVRKFFRLKK